MKNLLKFMGVVIGIIVWYELVKLSFYLMNLPDTFSFYGGFILLILCINGPLFYFKDNITMFLKNMKSVFFDERK